ncbi:Hypothetical_protein [Hexamita inflata]|uniref:Hypothetical_protein n=1 Tax=Hexamita inflata TaxID=28002 RepID=A0AA86NLH2_9EUKA|nr:Hypothetical protein HINF_LOCUS8873 [Hexamita inflata]
MRSSQFHGRRVLPRQLPEMRERLFALREPHLHRRKLLPGVLSGREKILRLQLNLLRRVSKRLPVRRGQQPVRLEVRLRKLRRHLEPPEVRVPLHLRQLLRHERDKRKLPPVRRRVVINKQNKLQMLQQMSAYLPVWVLSHKMVQNAFLIVKFLIILQVLIKSIVYQTVNQLKVLFYHLAVIIVSLIAELIILTQILIQKKHNVRFNVNFYHIRIYKNQHAFLIVQKLMLF